MALPVLSLIDLFEHRHIRNYSGEHKKLLLNVYSLIERGTFQIRCIVNDDLYWLPIASSMLYILAISRTNCS